jgi:hypothetical protein
MRLPSRMIANHNVRYITILDETAGVLGSIPSGRLRRRASGRKHHLLRQAIMWSPKPQPYQAVARRRSARYTLIGTPLVRLLVERRCARGYAPCTTATPSECLARKRAGRQISNNTAAAGNN